MDWYLLEQRQVTYAEDNRLKDTPSELEAIVDGTEVDIRNSIFQILSLLDNNDGCFDAYGYCTLTQEYFNRRNVLYPMKANPAIENVLIRDYNNCLQEVGLEGYHKDVCREKGWGNTWRLATGCKARHFRYDDIARPSAYPRFQRCWCAHRHRSRVSRSACTTKD